MNAASPRLRVALAQMDVRVGAAQDNARQMIAQMHAARDVECAHLALFPELAVSGCPAQDLLRRTDYLAHCRTAVEDMARAAIGIVAVVGWPQREGDNCYNAVSVLRDGQIMLTRRKQVLRADGALEARGFAAATGPACVFELAEVHVGLLIGDELDAAAQVAACAAAGAELLLVPAATPFVRGLPQQRAAHLAEVARTHQIAIAWLNRVGGHDALVFAGASHLADANGHVHPAAPVLEPSILLADYNTQHRSWQPLRWPADPAPSELAQVWRALCCGLRDYCRNNGFSRTWLGLSGGIDSAMVLALAVDALGNDNVTAVRMPSRYTSDLSNDLASIQCDALGVTLLSLPIERAFQGFVDTLAETFQGQRPDVTEENLQSRVRGSLMMALANKFGGLLLATGNKSEFAVGYATIYGDMCGGYAPLKDIYKTDVFALANWRNAQGTLPAIPPEVITRPPSAELRDNQRDEDSLPPYATLDAILQRHIEHDQSPAQIIAAGFDPATVEQVVQLVARSEWKRQQAAPGPKISVRAFGVDVHWPISGLGA